MDHQVQQLLTGHPAISTLTEGLGRGFLLYFLPVTVLKRQVKKNVLRRALAIGGFCGIARLIRFYTQGKEEKQERYFQESRDPNNRTLYRWFIYLKASVYKYPCHVAGAIGALAGVSLDPSLAESQLFAIWLLVRAFRCIAPPIPHASTAAMCIAASQILSSYIRAPNQLDSSYYRFLKIHGGQGKETLHTLLTRNDLTSLCPVIHPGQGCTSYWFTFFFAEFRRAMRVYAPLYVVFFLFSRSKNITFLVQNLLRSSTFLALYCTLAWISGCIFHRTLSIPMSRLTLFIHASVSGLATLVERKNRRAELAAYCVTYALDSVMKTITASDKVPDMPYFTPIIFCIAMAILVRYRKQQPWIFSHFMLGDEHPLSKDENHHGITVKQQ